MNIDQLKNDIELLNESSFWNLIDILKDHLSNSPKDDIESFMNSLKNETNPVELLISFVKTYEDKVKLAENSDSLLERVKIGSDDSWSDLCDYLPLHGQNVFEGVLNGSMEAPIYNESYIVSKLNDSLRLFVPHLIEKSPNLLIKDLKEQLDRMTKERNHLYKIVRDSKTMLENELNSL